MDTDIALIRYGLLMGGQPLEGSAFRGGRAVPGYFWGTLFEGRQDPPLDNGASHYPVAVLSPPKVRIRCEIGIQQVSDTRKFWAELFEKEMYFPHLPADRSLMELKYTTAFDENGGCLAAAVFVLNPLFYLFHKDRYGMRLTEVAPVRDGFVSWRDLVG